MTVHTATWKDGDRVMTGRWEYYWPGDFFHIWPDKGPIKYRKSYRDEPEWGKWKLQPEVKGESR